LRWEAVVDELTSEEPIVGLCAFDRTRLRPAVVTAVAAAHGRRDDA
jgi:hypothetical protein